MKKIQGKILLVLFLGLILLGLSYYQRFNSTANWKVYADPNNVLAFSYPPYWSIQADEQGINYLSLFSIIDNNKDLEKYIQVEVKNYNSPFEEWCKQDLSCNSYKKDPTRISFKKIAISEKEAYSFRFTQKCGACNSPFTTYYIPLKQHVVSIIKSSISKKDGDYDVHHKEELKALDDPIFDKIIRTFNFHE